MPILHFCRPRVASASSPSSSSQPPVLDARCPLVERLSVAARRQEAPQQSLHVVGEVRRRDLEPAYLASHAVHVAEVAAEVHLEGVDLRTVRLAYEAAHQPDVGDLEARTGVWAAVDIDSDRLVEVRHAVLQLAIEPVRALLGLDDGELAELDPRAGHGAPPQRART